GNLRSRAAHRRAAPPRRGGDARRGSPGVARAHLTVGARGRGGARLHGGEWRAAPAAKSRARRPADEKGGEGRRHRQRGDGGRDLADQVAVRLAGADGAVLRLEGKKAAAAASTRVAS